MIKHFATLLLLLVSIQVHATDVLEDLQQRLNKHAVIRADFEQTKKISGLNQPLKSAGKLIVSKKEGLWWHQATPFQLTLILSEQRMTQLIPNQPAQVITADSNPQMFQFNQLLSALFHADKAVLEKSFTLDLSMLDKQRWQLKLTPKAAPLDKLFSQITLIGDDFAHEISIDDKQGDSTTIRFSKHVVKPERLTSEEQHYFAS